MLDFANFLKVRWVYLREHMQSETYKLLLTGKENLISIIKLRLEETYGVDAYETLKNIAFGDFM